MHSNREIGRLFSRYAELLQLHEEDARLADYLSGAAYRLRNIEEEIIELPKAELRKLFRPQIVKIIEELETSGAIEGLENLIQLTPSGLFDMMRIKGLGGKKLATIWKKAKIDTVEDLLAACEKRKIAQLLGFGTKTQTSIISSIENLHSSANRYRYAEIAETAHDLLELFKNTFPTNKTGAAKCADRRLPLRS